MENYTRIETCRVKNQGFQSVITYPNGRVEEIGTVNGGFDHVPETIRSYILTNQQRIRRNSLQGVVLEIKDGKIENEEERR